MNEATKGRGRPRKQRVEAGQICLQHINWIIKRYKLLKGSVTRIEKRRPSLFEAVLIGKDAFSPERMPDKYLFSCNNLPGDDYRELDMYLGFREDIYLLEAGVYSLSGRTKEIAEDAFLYGLSNEQIIAKYNISLRTVTREKKQAKNFIARNMEDYMLWKAQLLYI